MMHRALTSLLAGAGMFAGAASADTLFFKDGSSLDGKVSQPNPNVYVLEVEGGRLSFQTEEVDRFEVNDKAGSGRVYAAGPKQQEHEAQRQSVTGLTAEQIEEAFVIMKPFSSEDANEVAMAQERLIAMHGRVDLMKFLEAAAQSTSSRSMPALLDTMVKIDPERAKETLVAKSFDPAPASRAKALELLGRTAATDEDVATVARGMVDNEPEVQLAAAAGIAESGDKRATPALIKGLESADSKVRNASAAALEKVWGTNAGDNADAWRRYWSGQAAGVKGAVSADTLEPLISREELALGVQYHE